MTVTEIRVANINYLAEKYSRNHLASKTDYSNNYINQLCGGFGSFGGRTARKIEVSLGLVEGWMDVEHSNKVNEAVKIYNTLPVEVVQELPLISRVQAGRLTEISDPYEVGDHEDVVPVTKHYSKHSFALRVQGDSMLPEFPDGCVICVDPEIEPKNGSYVVAKFPDTDEATFKQLAIDPPKKYLKPLNERYDLIPIDDDVVICGVVRQSLNEYE